MIVYNFHPQTGEFIGQELANVLPGRESLPESDLTKYSIPADATHIDPPAVQAGQARMWNGTAWVYIMDARGQTRYAPDRSPVVVDFIGDPAEHGLTETPAPYAQEEIDAQAAQLRLEEIKAVKNEAQRRIVLRTGATDFNSCIVRQLNASMRATELVNKKSDGGTLTQEEQAESIALQSLANDIKAIRYASNLIEAMDPIPSDYTDNKYW